MARRFIQLRAKLRQELTVSGIECRNGFDMRRLVENLPQIIQVANEQRIADSLQALHQKIPAAR